MFGDKAKTVVATKSARNNGLSPSGQAAAQEPDGVRRFSRPCLLALLALFLLLASLAGCDFVNEISAPTTTVPPTPTVAQPVAATESPAPTITPAAAITPSATGIVLRVSVGSPPSDLPKYDRGEWRHWIDEDSDCQNARQEALIAESSIAVAFRSDEQCHVTAGRWEGPYTGEVVTSPGDLDIDHMVPLENAHRSGAWAWDRERKREYANYLGYENHLIATISSANRSKGSKGPEAWRPPLESYWCAYAINWVTVKGDWGLTVTEAEYAALSEMLATCATPVLLQPAQGAAPSIPTATVPPTPVAGLRYDPFGPDRNCSDFDTYDEALAFFLAAGGPGEDPHRLDVNGDGEPCESLHGGPSARASPTPDSETTTALYATFTSSPTEGPADCPPNAPSGPDCPPFPSPVPTATVVPTATPAPAITPAFRPTPEPAPQPEQAAEPSPAPTPVSTPTPIPAPEPTAQPEDPFVDRDCGDFASWQEAQAFYLSEGDPDDDPHGLDGDGDGVACQSLPGAPDDAATPTPAPSPRPTPEPEPAKAAYSDLPFDPDGPDRNCRDFLSWWDAQNFYLAAGGPDEDPHRLDHNGDGIACESLSGAPDDDTKQDDSDDQPPPSQSTPTATPEVEFEDRNCDDFSWWLDAQNFYLAAGGPDEDPHRLDHNSDGIACESLLGAPDDDTERDDSDDQPPPSQSTPTATPEVEFEDRNCGDFSTWLDAQNFYLAAGGPDEDPHRLDHNSDGIACESLPGAPDDDTERDDSDDQPPPSQSTPTATPEVEFEDRNCGDFSTWLDAQNFYLAAGGPDEDPHRLDHNSDGIACESLPGAPDDDTERDDSDDQPPPSQSTPTATPEVEFEDRNCGDFSTWLDAQNFYLAAGGPDEDPHRLDHNSDGIACESLPGAPDDDTERDDSDDQPPPSQSTPTATPEVEFEDRNCGDFDTWDEAQAFFEEEGGPDDDPHRLDRDKDGIACESLPGAPEE